MEPACGLSPPDGFGPWRESIVRSIVFLSQKMRSRKCLGRMLRIRQSTFGCAEGF